MVPGVEAVTVGLPGAEVGLEAGPVGAERPGTVSEVALRLAAVPVG